MNEKGVFPVLVGGLGNQMFIMTAGYIISRRKGCPLYLTQNHNHYNQHNVLQIDYKKTIFKFFGKHLEMSESEFLSQKTISNCLSGFGSFCLKGWAKKWLRAHFSRPEL